MTQRSHRAFAGDGGVNHGNEGVDWAGGGSNRGFDMAQDCHRVVCSLSRRVKSLFTFVCKCPIILLSPKSVNATHCQLVS